MFARIAFIVIVTFISHSLEALDTVPQYHVVRLGPLIAAEIPGSESSVSFVTALNQNGDAVGDVWLSSSNGAWVYTPEHGVVALPSLPGFASARAVDVNDRDSSGEVDIVGVALSSLFVDGGRAVLWRFSTTTGTVLETRDIGTLPGYDESAALAVNNSGVVLGYSDGLTTGRDPMVYDATSEALDPVTFPASVLPIDINNTGQIVGGRYRADLFGAVEDLGLPPDCTTVSLSSINDLGHAAGRAGRPFTDGAGHFMVSTVRYTDTGWHVLPTFSHLDGANDINIHGDTVGEIGTSGAVRGALYIAALGEIHLLENLLAPEFDGQVFPWNAAAINDAGQVGAYAGDAVVLTPLGAMIIPGDVNGDAVVDLDDHCAWLTTPIDLDDDGTIDDSDELWLIDRLAQFGYAVEDCNGNAIGDHCDIVFATSLDCDENDVPDECQSDCDGDGTPDACEADCNANGVADPCDIALGTSDDCNENGVPDECDLGGTFDSANTFDIPIQLLPADQFDDDLLVTGIGTVEDVDFSIDLDYRIGDLTVQLSHAGVTVTLIDRPGYPSGSALGNGQLGYDIVLDDEGAGAVIESVGSFGSPFEPILSPPSYQPNNPLDAFDGLPAEGVWTVSVITTPSPSPLSSFRFWGLTIELAAVPVEPCDCLGGDTNGDGAIDVADPIALLAYLFDGASAPEPLAAGDANGDGGLDLADAIYTLAYLFTDGPAPVPCTE